MKRRTSISACLTLLASAIAACSSGDIPIAREDAGRVDAATTDAAILVDGSPARACADSECGAVPPIHPGECPTNKLITTVCERRSDNSCDWRVQCADKPASGLKWFRTCGDPVCNSNFDAGTADAGPDPVCAAEGTTCSQKGVTCGNPKKNCGVVRVCDDHDPTEPGCPISSAKFKDDIHYLRDGELERLHAETMSIRLATYQYKGQFADPNPTHLGFIIEDQPQSLSVDRGHDRVDMYGYLSMVVAAMQVQEKEIASLRKELDAAKTAPACGLASKR